MQTIISGLRYMLSMQVVRGIQIHWELIAVFGYCALVFLVLKTFQYNKND